MRHAYLLPSAYLVFILSAAAVSAQSVDLNGAVSGAVILDGTDFMFGQLNNHIINDSAQMTQRNLQNMQQLGNQRYQMMQGMLGQGGSSGRPHVVLSPAQIAAVEKKIRQLDTFAPSSSTAPHELAVQLGAGNPARTAQLEKSFNELLKRYHDLVHAPSDHVSIALAELIGVGYQLEQLPDSKTLAALGDATRSYVTMLQFISGRAATDAEKQRLFDTIAIISSALADAEDRAKARKDPQFTARVKAEANGVLTKMFGCSEESMPLADCIHHIGIGSTRVFYYNLAKVMSM